MVFEQYMGHKIWQGLSYVVYLGPSKNSFRVVKSHRVASHFIPLHRKKCPVFITN